MYPWWGGEESAGMSKSENSTSKSEISASGDEYYTLLF